MSALLALAPSPVGNDASVLVWLFVIGLLCWLGSRLGSLGRRRGRRVNHGHPEGGSTKRPSLALRTLQNLEKSMAEARTEGTARRKRNQEIKQQTREAERRNP